MKLLSMDSQNGFFQDEKMNAVNVNKYILLKMSIIGINSQTILKNVNKTKSAFNETLFCSHSTVT